MISNTNIQVNKLVHCELRDHDYLMETNLNIKIKMKSIVPMKLISNQYHIKKKSIQNQYEINMKSI